MELRQHAHLLVSTHESGGGSVHSGCGEGEDCADPAFCSRVGVGSVGNSGDGEGRGGASGGGGAEGRGETTGGADDIPHYRQHMNKNRCDDVNADYDGEGADDAAVPATIQKLCRELQDALTKQCNPEYAGEKWLVEELDGTGWELRLPDVRVQKLIAKKLSLDLGDALHKFYLRKIDICVPDLRHGAPPKRHTGQKRGEAALLR